MKNRIILKILVLSIIIGSLSMLNGISNATENTDIKTISTAEELINFAKEVNEGNSYKEKKVTLLKDIDLKGNDKNQWTAIGNYSKTPFEGTFEGNGHIISGIYINKTADYTASLEGCGLFGTNNGKIQNLGVAGKITVMKNGMECAGICAENNGTIYQCFNAVDIETDSCINVGGIVGWNGQKDINGEIKSCYNIGKIDSSKCTRGGTTGTGGIVGFNYAGSIINCYNIGEIRGREGSMGSIAGFSDTRPVNCYYLDTPGYEGYDNGNDEAGKVEKKSEEEFKSKDIIKMLNATNSKSFAFDEKNLNKGYPVLYWQNEKIKTEDEKDEDKENTINENNIKLINAENKLDNSTSIDETNSLLNNEVSDKLTNKIANNISGTESPKILPRTGNRKAIFVIVICTLGVIAFALKIKYKNIDK